MVSSRFSSSFKMKYYRSFRLRAHSSGSSHFEWFSKYVGSSSKICFESNMVPDTSGSLDTNDEGFILCSLVFFWVSSSWFLIVWVSSLVEILGSCCYSREVVFLWKTLLWLTKFELKSPLWGYGRLAFKRCDTFSWHRVGSFLWPPPGWYSLNIS